MYRRRKTYSISRIAEVQIDKCIGICTTMKPYAIADLVNKTLDIDVFRISDFVNYIELNQESQNNNLFSNHNQKETAFTHQLFYYYDEDFRVDYLLVQNKVSSDHLIKEYSNCDYLLFVFNDTNNIIDCAYEKLSEIKHLYCIKIAAETVNKIDELLEDFELHLNEEKRELQPNINTSNINFVQD